MLHGGGNHPHYSLFYWHLEKNPLWTGFMDWNSHLGKLVIFYYWISKPFIKEAITNNPQHDYYFFLPRLFLCEFVREQYLLE